MQSCPDKRAGGVFAQLPRFLLAGGFAALLNFASRFLFSRFVDFGLAVLLAYLVGFLTAFVLSRFLVFAPSQRAVSKQLGYFGLVNLLALAQTWLLSLYLAGVLEADLGAASAQALAHLAGIMLPVVSSYFGHKYLSFRQ